MSDERLSAITEWFVRSAQDALPETPVFGHFHPMTCTACGKLHPDDNHPLECDPRLDHVIEIRGFVSEPEWDRTSSNPEVNP